MKYVTYAPDGALTGAYMQALHAAHAAAFIEATAAQYSNWTAYKANADRTALELLPVVDPVTPVPTSVLMVQARKALIRAGHITTVNAAIAAMPGTEGDEARADWEFAPNVRRDSALTVAMAAVLGLTSAQVDALFVTAATL